MDLDLNLEPMDPMMGLGSLLSQLETASGCVEERIRQIEVVASRARQRQRRRQRQPQSTPQIVNFFVHSPTQNFDGETRALTATGENGNFGKNDGTHLVAKALAMDTVNKKVESDVVRGYYDCNICLEMSRDPVLTCCGHLYCWPCFYWLSYAHSNVRECPVCGGEVSDTSIIPIYGNVNGCNSKLKKESSINIPPRPRAPRIESLRQQIINGRSSLSSPFEGRIERFSNLVGRMGDEDDTRNTNTLATSTEAEENQQHQLFPGTSSSSSLTSAERLMEGLEAFISSHR